MRYAILLGLAFASPALAQGMCNLPASAKAGQFVRVPIYEAPSATSEVLEIAPDYRDEASGVFYGARFVVSEVRAGWAYVTGVTDWSGTVQAPDGWINAVNIVVLAQTNRGFAVASAASKVAWEGQDWPKAEALLECKDDWGKVLILGSGGTPVNAWVRGFCADQSAPCDGVTGD